MEPARFRQLEQWFTRAMHTPPAQLGALVAEATTSDPELGRELARMLATEPPDSLFGRLVCDAGRQVLAVAADGECVDVVPPAPDPVVSSPASGLVERLATRATAVDRYAIEGEVARGGMGVILRAFDKDLRRRLAMKVALDGHTAADAAGRQRIARFLAEAQVTSQLDHPGIVPVHEIGIDACARPYFTMRLVGGRNLDAVYALARQGAEGWSTARVLGVLLKVCDAVAYAHSNGVLHRDLKPANVMVGRFGEVYVMDWGLAKVLRADLAAAAAGASAPQDAGGDEAGADPAMPLRTADGTIMGTPAHMSPEQMAGDVAALDVRADVYALGTMLYQLFAGRAPYHDDGGAPGVARLRERILKAPPEPLGRCAPSTPPELVAIVERAMARDRAARYPSVAALAEDLRAYTEGRVVATYERGAWAELRKWVGRNRALASALAAAVLAVAVGAVAFAIKADQAATAATAASAARGDAERAAAEAGRNAATATRREAEARASERRAATIMQLVRDALVGSDPLRGGDRQRKVVEAMHTIVADLDRGTLRDDPETEASLQAMTASVLCGNSRHEAALELARSALETRRRLFRGDHAQVAESLTIVADCLLPFARMDEALPLYEEALGTYRRLLPGDDERTAAAMRSIANCLHQLGQGRRGLPLAEQAYEMARRLHPDGSHDTIAAGLGRVGDCLSDAGEFDRALVKYEAALAMDCDLFPGDHIRVARGLELVALTNKQIGRRSLARTQYEAALAMLTSLLGEHDAVVECLNGMGGCHSRSEALAVYQRALDMAERLHPGNSRVKATSLTSVGLCLLAQGRLEAALPQLRAALEMRQALYPTDHYVVARSLGNVAMCLLELGRPDQARPLLEQAWAIQQRVRSDDHPDLAVAAGNLAGCLQRLGQPELALPMYEAALEVNRRQPGATAAAEALCLSNLGQCLQSLGRHEEALDRLRAALALAERGQDQRLEAAIRNNLGSCLQALRRPEARAMFASALAILERMWASRPDHPEVAQAANNLGHCLCNLGEREQALLHFRRALSIREAVFADDHPLVGCSLHNLASVLQQMGRGAEALPLAERAHAIAATQPVTPPWSKSCAALLQTIRSGLRPGSSDR